MNIAKMLGNLNFGKLLQNIKLPPILLGPGRQRPDQGRGPGWGAFFSKIWGKFKISPGDWAIIKNPRGVLDVQGHGGPARTCRSSSTSASSGGWASRASPASRRSSGSSGPLNFFWGFASAATPAIMAPSDIFEDTDTTWRLGLGEVGRGTQHTPSRLPMSAHTAGVGELDWTIDPPEGWAGGTRHRHGDPDVISAWEHEVDRGPPGLVRGTGS